MDELPCGLTGKRSRGLRIRRWALRAPTLEPQRQTCHAPAKDRANQSYDEERRKKADVHLPTLAHFAGAGGDIQIRLSQSGRSGLASDHTSSMIISFMNRGF
jgi:hypothetical protein